MLPGQRSGTKKKAKNGLAAESGQRFAKLSEFKECASEIAVRIGIVRIEADGLLEGGDVSPPGVYLGNQADTEPRSALRQCYETGTIVLRNLPQTSRKFRNFPRVLKINANNCECSPERI